MIQPAVTAATLRWLRTNYFFTVRNITVKPNKKSLVDMNIDKGFFA
ncbi:hypothetical protein B4113_2705 [Geobacillus sp. B4113_201601]|nr:hypothetical protein B4113_2705 [Geobacillus sp. B4113_201601]